MNHRLSLILRVLPAVALFACATTSTRVATSWKSPAYGGMKNVLVVGISQDQATRRKFEDDFVKQLEKHKVAATPSYSVFSGEKLPSEDAVNAFLKEKMMDTVLITRVTDIKDVEHYVPGNTGPYLSYWGFYGRGWGISHTPGYTITHTEVVLETNLYNVASGGLEWAATSRTTTEGDRVDVVESFIPAIVQKMGQDKLF